MSILRFARPSALAALVCLAAVPAAALDLSKVTGFGGEGWKKKSASPELVQFTCATPSCPPSGQLAVQARPAPDQARDEVINDPQGTLAGYRRGFEKSAMAKACTFDNYRAEKVGDAGSRIVMDGDCPSGLTVMIATVFDRSQPGSMTIVASAMDRAKAENLRTQALSTLDKAIAAAR